ncbi:MAG: polyprenol monophosphomannose synthase, partial [Planctomycetia bacterium]|nr:polyprenol monophosphomannose synthase [Planctomycetia bacterium]
MTTAHQTSYVAHHTSDAPVDGRVLICVATYNEIENLPSLVDDVLQAAPACDLLVIDDGSPDGTGQWCDERAAAEPRLKCLHRSGKLGLGTAILAAMRYAIDQGYDYLLHMDADFSHDPHSVPDLLAGMNPAGAAPRDVMIGSRYIPGGRITGWPLKRHLMSQGVNVYSRLLLGLRARDVSGGFRCYRTAMLKKIDLGSIRSLGYSFQEEILWRLKQAGARIGETPITFVDRQRGVSKINQGEAWAAVRI